MKKITSILMLFLMCWGMVMQAGPTDLPQLSTKGDIKWYTIKNIRSGKFVAYDTDNTLMNQVVDPSEAALFYFTGKIENGVAIVKIHNAAAGEKMLNGFITKDHAVAWDATGVDWYIRKCADTGLSISINNATDVYDNSWNDKDGKGTQVDSWSATDPGSLWHFETIAENAKLVDNVLASMEIKPNYVGAVVSTPELKAQFAGFKEKIAAGDKQTFLDFCTAKSKLKTKLPEEGKTYVIKSADSRFTEQQNAEKAWYANSQECRWATFDEKYKSYFFQFEQASEVAGGYRIKSCVAADTYVGYQTEGKSKLITTADQSAAAIFSLQERGDFKYLIRINPQNVNPAVYVNAEGHLSGKGEKGDLVSYNVESDLASMWYIVEAQFDNAKSVDVTYNYKFNGELVHKETISQTINSAFEVPIKYKNGLMNYKIVTTGSVAENNRIVEIECTEKLPFEKTTDLGAPIWYAVEMGRQNNYMTVSGNSVELKNIASEKDIVENFVQPNSQWCFEGDVVKGFKIYNNSNDTEKALALTTDGQVNLVEPNSATVWELKWIGYNSVGHCFVNGDKYLGIKANVLEGITFGSGCDAGFYKSVDKVKQIAGKYNIAPAGAVGSYSYLNTLSNRDTYQQAYKDYCNNPVANSQKLVDQFRLMAESEINALDPNVYYRIKNFQRIFANTKHSDRPGRGGYMGTSPYPNNLTELTCGTDKLDDAGTVWKLETATNGEGYKLKNLNNGKYVGKYVGNQVTMESEEGVAGIYKLQKYDNLLYKFDISGKKLHPSGGKFMYYDDMASCWYLVPATELEVSLSNIDGTCWASLYLPFDVTLPEKSNLSVYTGTLNGDRLKMKQIEDIPANQGVILKGNESKYTLNIQKATSSVEGNQLEGTNIKIDKINPNDYFVLAVGKKSGVVGFYRPANAYLKPNKAFIYEPSSAETVLRFDFNDEPTGIEDVELKATDANAVYDLSGRRVEKPMKGIYIKNGKKIIVK